MWGVGGRGCGSELMGSMLTGSLGVDLNGYWGGMSGGWSGTSHRQVDDTGKEAEGDTGLESVNWVADTVVM